MATYPYGSAAGVRRQHTRITADLVIDDDIETILENDVDKGIIDPVLIDRGAPFATAPAAVVLVSNMLGAAAIHEAYLSHTGAESDWARAKREEAMDRLDKIKAGDIGGTGLTDATIMVLTDPAATRPATEIYTGDDLEWSERTEERE